MGKSNISSSTVTSSGLTRQVNYNSATGESTRASKSAGTHVDNGRHSSAEAAQSEARRDIDRGPRSPGDKHYRGK